MHKPGAFSYHHFCTVVFIRNESCLLSAVRTVKGAAYVRRLMRHFPIPLTNDELVQLTVATAGLPLLALPAEPDLYAAVPESGKRG